MKGVLVDSNIIIDIFTEDPQWCAWSSEQLEKLGNKYVLFINKIIYGEVSISFNKIEELEQALPNQILKRSQIPWEAAFLAGKIFLQYKKLGGNRSTPLPDFIIGAHAAVGNLILLTRDDKRFRYYFPKITMICPS